MTVLHHLAEQGHKVSQHKLQLWSPKVTYLGHTLTGEGKKLLDSRKLAVQNAPKPLTKQQMMTFLRLCNFCRTWIPEYTKTVQPMQDLIYGRNLGLKDKLQWTPAAGEAFSNLKLALQTNTVLALPDYDKPFYLHVDGGAGYMKAVLAQAFGEKQRPLAFYSCKLDSVAILLQANLSYLTHARQLSYVGILLSQSHIKIEKCAQLNPSTLLATPEEGHPHCCKQKLDEETKPRADIHSTPQPGFADIFVDGSASKNSLG